MWQELAAVRSLLEVYESKAHSGGLGAVEREIYTDLIEREGVLRFLIASTPSPGSRFIAG